MTLMINVTALRIPNIRHTIRQSRPRPPTKSGSDERPLAEGSAQIHSRYCLLFEQRPRSVRRWGSVGPLAWTGYEGLRGGFDLITLVRLCEDVLLGKIEITFLLGGRWTVVIVSTSSNTLHRLIIAPPISCSALPLPSTAWKLYGTSVIVSRSSPAECRHDIRRQSQIAINAQLPIAMKAEQQSPSSFALALTYLTMG